MCPGGTADYTYLIQYDVYAYLSQRYEEFRTDGSQAALAKELKALQKEQHDEEYRQTELDESVGKMEGFEDMEHKIKSRKAALDSEETALQVRVCASARARARAGKECGGVKRTTPRRVEKLGT